MNLQRVRNKRIRQQDLKHKMFMNFGTLNSNIYLLHLVPTVTLLHTRYKNNQNVKESIQRITHYNMLFQYFAFVNLEWLTSTNDDSKLVQHLFVD